MANTIVLKRSSVAAKVPTTTDLSLGEIAINTFDGKVYIKKNDGSDAVVELTKADLANVQGTLALSNGGTGATTQNAAANKILPDQTSNSGKFLTTNGTNSSWASVSAAPAGSTGQVQYNNAGTTAGATNITVSATGNMILKSAASDTPTGTDLVVFNEVNFPSGLSTRNSYGVETALQRTIGTCEIGWWNPPGNATTVPGVLGMAAPTAQGTATVRSVTLTNIATRAKRLGYVSASTTSAMCGHYWNAGQFAIGNGSGLGGFYMNWRFCISDATMVPEASLFIGVSTLTAAPTAGDPVTHLNCIAVGHAYGDTTLRIYYGGSTAQPLINLGANFPVNKTDLYEFSLYAPNNVNNVVYYRVKRLGTTFEATGTLTGTAGVALPAATSLLAPRVWRTNNGIGTPVGIDVVHFYTETQQY